MQDLASRFLESVRQEKLRWIHEFGRFIVAFGGIEFEVDVCLQRYLDTKGFEATIHKGFMSRANEALRVVETTVPDQSIRRRMVRALEQAKQLAPDRNLIAHNPLRMGVVEDENGALHFRPEIRPFRNNSRFLLFPDLQRLADRAEAVSDALADLLEADRLSRLGISPPPEFLHEDL
jgi:hypothetical protein